MGPLKWIKLLPLWTFPRSFLTLHFDEWRSVRFTFIHIIASSKPYDFKSRKMRKTNHLCESAISNQFHFMYIPQISKGCFVWNRDCLTHLICFFLQCIKRRKWSQETNRTRLTKALYYSEYGIGIKPKKDCMERTETTICDKTVFSSVEIDFSSLVVQKYFNGAAKHFHMFKSNHGTKEMQTISK